jgi:hypothetical protein
MPLPKSNLNEISWVGLFVNGLIFIFYAIFVPTFVQGVHGLITLAAVLFIVALPAIYHYLGKVRKGAAKAVAVLFGVGMVLIIVSDLLFVSSLLPRFTHDSISAFGDALFVISLLAIGVLAWKGDLPKWFGILSLVAGIVGVLTYIPGAALLAIPSLFLVGIWSFGMGFILRRTK